MDNSKERSMIKGVAQAEEEHEDEDEYYDPEEDEDSHEPAQVAQ